jgi:hypothetical protein
MESSKKKLIIRQTCAEAATLVEHFFKNLITYLLLPKEYTLDNA